jgi:UDP-N-acetylmuramoyl-L-alanyl-D-glutamate--2,6-diaminopimelate ligase
VICVYGCHDEEDLTGYSASGRVIGAMADLAVATHGYPSIDSHRSCMELRAGFADPRKAQVIVDRTEAIAWALHEARAGDVVVIAGLGDRRLTPDAAEKELINDCEIVRQLLRDRKVPLSHQRMVA